MKLPNPAKHISRLLTIALLAVGCHAAIHGAEKKTTHQTFASPEEAANALRSAAMAKDKAALHGLFGPEFKELLTGDEVLDANNAASFAAHLSQSMVPVKEGDAKIVFEIGTNNWPMPVPLVRSNGQWYFDTAAGREEIIARHIGKDELVAIGVCRAYVKAQREYLTTNPGHAYAQKFKSTPGKKDGLFWEAAPNEPASPFGPLVADAHAEGYGNQKGSNPHPFHGYYFRILTRQGKAADSGKMNYVSHGSLTAGFALVAYPVDFDNSGIMTFIVNQDGKLYQRSLGEKSTRIAAGMTEYNPDSSWTLVKDDGIPDAVAEKYAR